MTPGSRGTLDPEPPRPRIRFPGGHPHSSLPRGAPTNSSPLSPSSPPLAAKVHLGGTEPCGRGWGGGVVPPAHSPTLTAGACGDSTLAPEQLASLGPPLSSPPTHALAAGPSFTLPPSPLQGRRKDLASTSLDTTLPQNLVLATSDLLLLLTQPPD